MSHYLRAGALGPVLAASLALTLGACAEQQVPASTPMQLGAATLAPRGYLQFCLRRPDQCGLRTPLTEIKNAALQAALNREEWTNVLSVRRPPTPTPAPQQAEVIEAVVEAPNADDMAAAEVTSVTGLDGGALSLVGVEAVAAPPAVTTMAAAPAPVATPRVSPVSNPEPASTGAPTLEQLFQDVHRAAQTASLHYGPRLWQHLEEVNAEINARIKPRTDEEAFGVDDYWTLPLDTGGRAEGNCKHYALEKRRMLIEAGMSEDVLSLAIVRTPQGETHAVLVVATDRG